MLADPEWRSRAGRKSAEIADTFDKSVFGERIEALYLEVLNQKRS
jgi:hypothetical protein